MKKKYLVSILVVIVLILVFAFVLFGMSNKKAISEIEVINFNDTIHNHELNEYGFYYDVHYNYASADVYDNELNVYQYSFVFKENGTFETYKDGERDTADIKWKYEDGKIILSYTFGTISVIDDRTVLWRIGEDGAWPYYATVDDSIYLSGDYIYCYGGNVNGWSVVALNNNKLFYGAVESEINGYAVVNMDNTFKDCRFMIKAPKTPKSVVNK